MNVLVSIQSELLKTRRTAGWYIIPAAALIMAFLMAIDYYHTPANAVGKVLSSPWTNYLTQGFIMSNLFMFPLLILLICTLLPQLEFKNNTWKQVRSSPQLNFTVFMAKFAVILLMAVLFLLCLDLSLVAFTYLIDYERGDYLFKKYPVPVAMIISFNIRSIVCILCLTAIQFWMGLRFRNFIMPLAIGFAFWILGVLVAVELKLPGADWHPYTYSIYAMFEKFRDKWTVIMWRSVLLSALVLAFAFWDFKAGMKRSN